MKRELSDSDSEQDLLDDGCGSPMHHSGMDRKKRRGIIEKRRRDRINHSLTELKRLVPAAYEKQGSAKLEKAEILQMTVDHLKILQQQKGFSYPDPSAIAMDYRSLGFRECAGEVARYLMSVEGMDSHDPLRLRLLSHLQCFSHQRESEMAKSRMAAAAAAATVTPPAPHQGIVSGASGGPTWMAAAATGGAATPGPTAATSVYGGAGTGGHPHSGATTPVGFVSDPLAIPPHQQPPQLTQHTSTNPIAQPPQQQQPSANQIAAQQQQQQQQQFSSHHIPQHMNSAQLCPQAASPGSNFALIGSQHHMTTSSASTIHMHHNNGSTAITSAGAHQSPFVISQTPSPNQYQAIQGMNKPYRPWGTELGAY